MTALALLTPDIVRTEATDGFVLEARTPLPEGAAAVPDWLDHWASIAPTRTFLAERDGDDRWRTVTYADAKAHVAALATTLTARGAAKNGPICVLSDNSIAHALVMLAGMHLGVPVASISPAYGTASSTFRRLRHIASLLSPSVVFVHDRAPFEKALDAIGVASVLTAADVDAALGRPAAPRAEIDSSTIAKVLFTSGSTGEPKGVVNTHRMLTANQESLAATWPFLRDEPPVVVDWLPWSHTFGGNHNLNLVLRNGGTLYVDRGRPAPGLVDVSLTNMADVGPTVWFNVPRGFDQAVLSLEKDAGLAGAVFRNLRVLFYAAAALGSGTRARLEKIAASVGRPDLFFTSAWGSTETAPLATSAHYETATTGVLGVPVPGVAIKLARTGDRLEIRVKGPNVTPGYWTKGGGLEPALLDADGFLPTGDAGRLVDENDLARGIAFAGRISENFKLSSGTWVNVGAVRLAVVDACAPLVLDAVVAGHDREALGVLLVPSPGASSALSPVDLGAKVLEAIARYDAAHPASSERIDRALLLDRPLSLDEGETTDKGYTNQRRVLDCRSADVERLFASPPAEGVLVIDQPRANFQKST